LLQLEGREGEIRLIGNQPTLVKKEAYSTLQFFVILDRSTVKSWKTPIDIGLYEGAEKIKHININFLGPEVYE
jgi:hypothetical protein